VLISILVMVGDGGPVYWTVKEVDKVEGLNIPANNSTRESML